MKYDQYYQNTREQRQVKNDYAAYSNLQYAALALEGIWFKGLQMGLIVV